jgi:predicted unusual protein kinase regulating ubiquinone biosynthesis (AarF/ABC1/UbiB family)
MRLQSSKKNPLQLNSGLSAYMRMIFKDQFIHGDLHPGNVMVKLLDLKLAMARSR